MDEAGHCAPGGHADFAVLRRAEVRGALRLTAGDISPCHDSADVPGHQEPDGRRDCIPTGVPVITIVTHAVSCMAIFSLSGSINIGGLTQLVDASIRQAASSLAGTVAIGALTETDKLSVWPTPSHLLRQKLLDLPVMTR